MNTQEDVARLHRFQTGGVISRHGKSTIDTYTSGIHICKPVLSLDGGSAGLGIREGFLSLLPGALICAIALHLRAIALKLPLTLLMRVRTAPMK